MKTPKACLKLYWCCSSLKWFTNDGTTLSDRNVTDVSCRSRNIFRTHHFSVLKLFLLYKEILENSIFKLCHIPKIYSWDTKNTSEGFVIFRYSTISFDYCGLRFLFQQKLKKNNAWKMLQWAFFNQFSQLTSTMIHINRDLWTLNILWLEQSWMYSYSYFIFCRTRTICILWWNTFQGVIWCQN